MIITKKNAWEKIQIYINVLNYGLIFTVAIYITYVSYRYGSTYVTWHAWLCTFGVSTIFQNKRRKKMIQTTYQSGLSH